MAALKRMLLELEYFVCLLVPNPLPLIILAEATLSAAYLLDPLLYRNYPLEVTFTDPFLALIALYCRDKYNFQKEIGQGIVIPLPK